MSLFKTITEKPWERRGIIGGMRPEGAFATESERVALVYFLVIASVVFSLFLISYYIRMELPDWRPLSEPGQLWFNTGLLVLSSVCFQWARNIVVNAEAQSSIATDGQIGKPGSLQKQQRNLYMAFFGAGVLAVLFIAGQVLTWENLQAGGHYMTSNPANAFYYLLTGLHAVHLLGGLWVWSKGSIHLLSGGTPTDIKLSIELCTLYWHFLLLVWLVLFGILANT